MDIIVDIDGTLADIAHRLHFIRSEGKPDWDSFFDACGSDEPITPVVALTACLSARPNTVIYCSGRTERVRNTTESWLKRVGLWPKHLYMRADGDHRPDDIIKRELLARIRADGFDPVLAIDDRKRVVDMWRAEGLICAQVAEGEF